MDKNKILLAGAAIILVGFVAYKTLSSQSYEPIIFMGEKYTHVEKTEVNKVENHFFTPGGVDVNEAGRFIQISKYDHVDLTADQVSRVQHQVITSFALRAVEGYDDRFFGLYRGSVPVYGYMGADAFVLHVGPEQINADNAEVRAAAAARIDELSRIPTAF
ncbi:MAG: hypothetical protein WBB42_06490 [Polyangiales bacterium]